nr:MAG TPA: SH3-like domain protein [Caudoviricetes sp.]
MFKVGDNVVMVDKERHAMYPGIYPPYGTTGVIMDIDETDKNYIYEIQWEKGTTSSDDRWWIYEDGIKFIERTTDEEVWEMLKPKMERIVTILADVDNFHDEVKKMVVDAYRSGYGRAMKGRPFKIKPKNTVKN